QFGQSQFAELGELISIPHPPPPPPPIESTITFGGGSGRMVRFFADRTSEPFERTIIHRALSVEFDGESTSTATISPRAFLKARFSRESEASGRVVGIALMRAAHRISSRRCSMKVIG